LKPESTAGKRIGLRTITEFGGPVVISRNGPGGTCARERRRKAIKVPTTTTTTIAQSTVRAGT